MNEYISVLNSVICLREIKKITIHYDNGTNYSNEWIQTLWVEYKDGKIDKFQTTDRAKARNDYEALKEALLNVGNNAEPKEIEGERE